MPVKISQLPAGTTLTGAEVVPAVQNSQTVGTTVTAIAAYVKTLFAASGGSALVAYIFGGTGAVATTVQAALRRSCHVDDFGADATGVADSTAAFGLARDAMNALGGGTVHMGPGTYKISNFSFGTAKNVIFDGGMSGYAYDQDQGTGTKLSCTTGTYAVLIPYGSLYCGIQNCSIVSNGALNSTPPCPVVTAGVEYGIVITVGVTTVRNVTVNGFQYGCGVANLGNSNIFEECNFSWNTKVGFFCTLGTAATFAAMHPNLSVPGSLGQSTVMTLRNCIMRRNGWGMILEDGQGTCDSCVVESNFFGGLWISKGTTLWGGPSWDFKNRPHFENNFAGYDNTSKAYTITQNNLLQVTAGVWPSWTINATNHLSDAGYQIYFDSEANGTNTGPDSCVFDDAQIVMNSPLKAAFLRSAYHTTFNRGSNSSAAGTSNWKLGNTAGTKSATATLFADFGLADSPPVEGYGNRTTWWQVSAAGNGGINWLVGGASSYGTYTGTVVTGDMTTQPTGTIEYATDGEQVTLTFPASFTGTSAAVTFRIDGMLDALLPSAARDCLIPTQDNGGAATLSTAQVGTNGRITLLFNIAGSGSGGYTNSGTKSLLPFSITYIK